MKDSQDGQDERDTVVSFERFIAGDDRLAGVLRALPSFEPSPEMSVRFAALARAAQAAHANQVTPVFAPPASLEASFLAEAARIQAAQQPRHDAVIEQIQAGKAAAEVLGHDVTAATTAWLENRANRMEAAPEPLRNAPKKGWALWWPRFGVVVASAFFGGIATNLWLAQRAGQAPLATAMNEQSAAAPAAAPALPPTTTLEVAPIAQISAVGRRDAAPVAAPRKEARVEIAEAERRSTQRETAAVADLAKAEAPMRDRMNEPQAAAPAEQHSETLAMASAKPAQAPSVAEPAAAPPAAAAGALSMERKAYRAAPAPVASMAAPAAPMAKTAAGASTQFRFELSSEPQAAVDAWLGLTREYAPRIFAAHPESDAVRSWAERFRQNLPREMRPERIKIVQDKRLDDNVLRLGMP
ncbi:MAG: hypothetical protein JWL63_3608 [Rhodocyclales bacterium]|nr:hypothetical protein [Rhodocyclales bacterium]